MTEREKQRRAVMAKVRFAIKAGLLVRQPCEVCGQKPERKSWSGLPLNEAETVVAHHDDYSKPLDVRWLCRQHHAEHHRRMGAYRNPSRGRGRIGSPIRDRVVAEFQAGVRVATIADSLQITTQRVYQHLNRARQLGELLDEEATP